MGFNIKNNYGPNIEDIKTFATYKRKIPDIVKAEDTQTDCFMCHEDIIESLPFLED